MAGYSGTPLVKKLGIKSGAAFHVSGAPDEYFSWLAPLPKGIAVKAKIAPQLDFIHLFVTDFTTYKKKFSKAAQCLKDDGMIWVSWPKKASKIETDLDENVIRDFGLSIGLVDVKVCAVSEIWSGLKFVIRVANRKK